MQYVGFWRRAGAYLVDVLPILILSTAFFYFFCGFDVAIHDRVKHPNDLQARVRFLAQRNQVRDFAFLFWLVYSVVMEASKRQGTFGKVVFRIKVVDENGSRLTLKRSVIRNLSKILSYLSLGLGFLWVVFSAKKQSWHDKLAHTFVTAS